MVEDNYKMTDNELKPDEECLVCEYAHMLTPEGVLACSKPDWTVEFSNYAKLKKLVRYPHIFDPVWKNTKCRNFRKNEEK
jgi:hypothetical protein